jgi:hypothetical protein
VHDVIDYMPRGSMMYHSDFSTQTKYHCEPNILHVMNTGTWKNFSMVH